MVEGYYENIKVTTPEDLVQSGSHTKTMQDEDYRRVKHEGIIGIYRIMPLNV